MELRFASDSPSGFVAFSLCAKQAVTGWLAGAESEVILYMTCMDGEAAPFHGDVERFLWSHSILISNT
jgi:hypothetical protein